MDSTTQTRAQTQTQTQTHDAKIKKSNAEKIQGFFTIENIKFEIMRTAYGNPRSVLYGLDARSMIIWYLAFTIVPWLFYEMPVLIGLFLVVATMAALSRVSVLIIGLMAFGFVTQSLTTLGLVLLFGGNLSAIFSLMTVSIKLLIVSLATVSIFTSMDPEKLGDALLRFGFPDRFCFAISYGYRVLPMLIDEYNGIFNSFRLRGMRPEAKFGGLNIVGYYIKLVIKSFYPMILNTAKRVKMTVEALETKGLSRGARSKKVMTLKFSYMKVTWREVVTFGILTVAIILAIVVGKQIPWNY